MASGQLASNDVCVSCTCVFVTGPAGSSVCHTGSGSKFRAAPCSPHTAPRGSPTSSSGYLKDVFPKLYLAHCVCSSEISRILAGGSNCAASQTHPQHSLHLHFGLFSLSLWTVCRDVAEFENVLFTRPDFDKSHDNNLRRYSPFRAPLTGPHCTPTLTQQYTSNFAANLS